MLFSLGSRLRRIAVERPVSEFGVIHKFSGIIELRQKRRTRWL